MEDILLSAAYRKILYVLCLVSRISSLIILQISISCIAVFMPALAMDQNIHPMSGLTLEEYQKIIQILKSSGYVEQDSRFPAISLVEPPKAEVLKWPGQGSLDRLARVTVRQRGGTYEADVDLTHNKIGRWQYIAGAQPGISSKEWATAEEITKNSTVWRAGMRARGYDSFDSVFCEAYSAGYFGEKDESRRLIKMPCFDISGKPNNLYGRPIEGLFTVIDLNASRLVEVVDTGARPLALPIGLATRPIPGAGDETTEPTHKFLSGGRVQWNKWSFYLRFDRRLGAIISLVSFEDAGRERSIAYQASVSEMFVPYMDSDIGWSYRTFMDIGEFGFGSLSAFLVEGIDCPNGSQFQDPVLTTDSGVPYIALRRVCVFERKKDFPLWRHSEELNSSFVGRSGSELVVRSIATVGNYDYVIDYVFDENAVFHIEVGATGYPAVKGVLSDDMSSPAAADDTSTGTLVGRHLVAVNHDHFLSFRVDLDIDGPENSFIRERLVTQTLPVGTARRTIWRREQTQMETEGGLSAGHQPEVWRVINPNKITLNRDRPGYEILPGHASTSLLGDEDWPQRRAGFSKEQLWITRYKSDELYAAGDYPNQSHGGEGLPTFAKGENIENTDIVVWCTMGFHHVTRPEDWPIQSTQWHSITFSPFGFFAGNPSLNPSDKARKDHADPRH